MLIIVVYNHCVNCIVLFNCICILFILYILMVGCYCIFACACVKCFCFAFCGLFGLSGSFCLFCVQNRSFLRVGRAFGLSGGCCGGFCFIFGAFLDFGGGGAAPWGFGGFCFWGSLPPQSADKKISCWWGGGLGAFFFLWHKILILSWVGESV